MRAFFLALGFCLAAGVPAAASADTGVSPDDTSVRLAAVNGRMAAYAEAVEERGPDPGVPGPGALDWAAAAEMALRGNPALAAARAAVGQADQQVRIAEAGFLPVVSAAADINRGHGTQYFDGGILNTSSGSYSGELQGSWNLFNGFATLAATAEARDQVASSRAAYDQASSSLYLSLGQAFAQVLYDQEELALLQVLVARYHQDTLYQEQEFKGGLTALWTYEKAQADEAGEVWARNQGRYTLSSDRAALAELLGREGPADGLWAAGDLTVSAAPADDRADLARMLQANPTLAYYAALARQEDAAVWAAESTRYPSIGVSGSWGTSGEETWGPRNKEWQASLNFSYNLFAGGADEAAVTQADLALAAARATVDSQREQLEAAFQRAWVAYVTSFQRLPSAEMSVRAGVDRFATVGALYQAGREEFLDYEQAESIYSGAQTQRLSALLTAVQDQVAYRYAMGVTLERAARYPAP